MLVARKDTTSPLACVCVAAAVNVLLDWIAVGVMGKGAAGAAWATTAALYAGAVAILGVLKRKGFMDAFPWGEFRWKDQIGPVMAFAGPITFLVFALLSIYTTLIIMSNALGVTVSAAHRIAGNIFAVAVLCGDPLIQAGQAFMPRYSIPRCPNASPRGRWRVCCRGSGCSPGSARPLRARSCASSAAGRLLETPPSWLSFALWWCPCARLW